MESSSIRFQNVGSITGSMGDIAQGLKDQQATGKPMTVVLNRTDSEGNRSKYLVSLMKVSDPNIGSAVEGTENLRVQVSKQEKGLWNAMKSFFSHGWFSGHVSSRASRIQEALSQQLGAEWNKLHSFSSSSNFTGQETRALELESETHREEHFAENPQFVKQTTHLERDPEPRKPKWVELSVTTRDTHHLESAADLEKTLKLQPTPKFLQPLKQTLSELEHYLTPAQKPAKTAVSELRQMWDQKASRLSASEKQDRYFVAMQAKFEQDLPKLQEKIDKVWS